MIKTLVIPVAGLGTRFLPATKAIPKEMLPIVDKPLIQYAVEEAMEAGITHIVFITNANKPEIENHFSHQPKLEATLKAQKNFKALESIQSIPGQALQFTYIEQSEPLGLGHAILCAHQAVNEPYFAVLLPDDLIDGQNQGCLAQMVNYFKNHTQPMIAVEEVAPDKTHLYGIVATDSPPTQMPTLMTGLVEKPKQNPPSCFAVVGRYILPQTIFEDLAQIKHGLSQELQITTAIAEQLTAHPYLAFPFQGTRFDCGSKAGYLQAMFHYAKQSPELFEALTDLEMC